MKADNSWNEIYNYALENVTFNLWLWSVYDDGTPWHMDPAEHITFYIFTYKLVVAERLYFSNKFGNILYYTVLIKVKLSWKVDKMYEFSRKAMAKVMY